MFLAAGQAAALGLGRLNVQSALGESLRAEIDITSMTPEEEGQFRARVAAPDAYRAAGVDYNAVLPGTQVSLQRRPDGRPFLRITSERVVQEPFVDMILELSWSSGRLVREYTLLLDPPVTRQASGSTTAPALSSSDGGSGASSSRSRAAAAAAASEPSAAASRAPRASERRAESAPARSSEPARTAGSEAGEDEYTVRRGDTLYSIAGRVQRSGVSLDQMLVALYRSNPNAFIGNNANRLKSGAVLSVPSTEQAQSVSTSEARQIIQAQSADFAAYRQRLAGAVPSAGTDEPGRQASGKVDAAVEDRKEATSQTPDRLTLSKGALGAKGAPSTEDRIAKERAKQEGDTRVAELSKNLQDLKSIKGGEAASGKGKAGASGSPAPAAAETPVPGVQVPAAPPVAPPPAPAASVAPPPPVTAPAPASAPVEPPVAASEPALTASAEDTASAAEAAPPVASEAASEPAPVPAPPPAPAVQPVEEPGLMAMLQDNLALVGGGLLALLLGGFALYTVRSKAKKDSGETSFLESRLQPDSFFGASGGQRIDTKDASGAPSSLSYSLSQLDAIGDVDPVAEADVYLAYGRDLQAEEILKEAMRATPERLAIRTKLLEVYAKRRDTKGFELLATQLYSLTGGQGEDWARAQELGRQVDPDNVLYQPGGAPADARVAAAPVEPLGATTMPHSVMPPAAAPRHDAQDSEGPVDLDLDLPMSQPPAAAPMSLDDTKPFSPAPQAELPEFDMPDLEVPAPASAGVRDLDMSFDLPDLPPAAEPVRQPEPASSNNAMDFSLDDLSLDLNSVDPNETTRIQAAPSQPATFDELPDFQLDDVGDAGDPLARKLELAEEFRQIGDREGARELLQEVVTRSSGALKAKAQTMLEELA
ncbi:FimV/HubP family polar landmark protein [Eleftheria terrae]|uniref:FimV/HubP family polar landmark protein n=1 Tax=Eleftheria terrae TaxID=1597781 RepID=UPI00263BD02F|nr:FimV/HubP family polar landmark protein [Eleftheria terrae]WKB52560.1 LysM peptidoglycan-binding domain-containing protein [Eleftheria terrae]